MRQQSWAAKSIRSKSFFSCKSKNYPRSKPFRCIWVYGKLRKLAVLLLCSITGGKFCIFFLAVGTLLSSKVMRIVRKVNNRVFLPMSGVLRDTPRLLFRANERSGPSIPTWSLQVELTALWFPGNVSCCFAFLFVGIKDVEMAEHAGRSVYETSSASGLRPWAKHL